MNKATLHLALNLLNRATKLIESELKVEKANGCAHTNITAVATMGRSNPIVHTCNDCGDTLGETAYEEKQVRSFGQSTR